MLEIQYAMRTLIAAGRLMSGANYAKDRGDAETYGWNRGSATALVLEAADILESAHLCGVCGKHPSQHGPAHCPTGRSVFCL